MDPAGTGAFFAPPPPGLFKPEAQGFDSVNAWWLCEISRLIYLRDAQETGKVTQGPTRNEILAGFGMTERHFFHKPQVQGAIIESRNRRNPFAVLVFRGTRGRLPNWLANLDILPVPWPGGGKVHGGFKKLFFQIWPEIEPELLRLNQPLFYTGHSLGAALATLAASVAPPRAVYTFGSPRVGDAAFVQAVKPIHIYRIATPRDIVTTLPPSLGRMVYRHAGSAEDDRPHFQTTRSLEMPFENRPRQDSAVQAPIAGLWQRMMAAPPGFLADHAPSNYRALFEEF